jgi:AcrR family transcriptional regulator
MSSAARREQIIEMAVTTFAESGVEGTSVEELAASAGVSKPLIYEHFGSKEGLYAVVVDRRRVDRVFAPSAQPLPSSRISRPAVMDFDYWYVTHLSADRAAPLPHS